MRRWGLIAAAAVALATPVAQAKAPLQVGAVTPELLTRTLVPDTVADLRAANLADAARVTLTWKAARPTWTSISWPTSATASTRRKAWARTSTSRSTPTAARRRH